MSSFSSKKLKIVTLTVDIQKDRDRQIDRQIERSKYIYRQIDRQSKDRKDNKTIYRQVGRQYIADYFCKRKN